MDLIEKKPSDFRLWVQKFYQESCLERLTWNQKADTIEKYWHNYKYWLKREYQHQRKQHGG